VQLQNDFYFTEPNSFINYNFDGAHDTTTAANEFNNNNELMLTDLDFSMLTEETSIDDSSLSSLASPASCPPSISPVQHNQQQNPADSSSSSSSSSSSTVVLPRAASSFNFELIDDDVIEIGSSDNTAVRNGAPQHSTRKIIKLNTNKPLALNTTATTSNNVRENRKSKQKIQLTQTKKS
jgi:hypothetical protein